MDSPGASSGARSLPPGSLRIGGAGNAAVEQTGEDADLPIPAAQVADEREGEVREPSSKSTAVHQGAGGKEERHRQQQKLASPIDDVLS